MFVLLALGVIVEVFIAPSLFCARLPFIWYCTGASKKSREIWLERHLRWSLCLGNERSTSRIQHIIDNVCTSYRLRAGLGPIKFEAHAPCRELKSRVPRCVP